MNNKWENIKLVAQFKNSEFRPIKAYVVNADGSNYPIDGENIYLEIDDERGLFIPLYERKKNEGIGIRSMPQIITDEEDKPLPSSGKSSAIVMRNGGANLVYLSPEV